LGHSELKIESDL